MMDQVEIWRAARELEQRHGASAYAYAQKLAAKADKAGDAKDREFWKAVGNALEPRLNSG